jgi:hypothetical protein
MARPKSTTGVKPTRSKANDTTTSKDTAVDAGSSVASTDVKPVLRETTTAQTPAERAPAAEPNFTRQAETAQSNTAQEAKPASEARKIGVVKSEPRKNVVVPINLEDEIRRRAYELYQQRGSAPGSEAEDWFTAEREVRERYQQRHQQQSA